MHASVMSFSMERKARRQKDPRTNCSALGAMTESVSAMMVFGLSKGRLPCAHVAPWRTFLLKIKGLRDGMRLLWGVPNGAQSAIEFMFLPRYRR